MLAAATALSLVACNSNKKDYEAAVTLYNGGDYAAAQEAFVALGDYEDSAAYAKNCGYQIETQEFVSLIDSVPTSNLFDSTSDISRARELYEALSADARNFLGETYYTKLTTAEENLNHEIGDMLNNALDMANDKDMAGAFAIISSVKQWAEEKNETGLIVLITEIEDIIQNACYPNTLIVREDFVTAYPTLPITTEEDETDDYAVYTYYYSKVNTKLDASKTDTYGFNFGFDYYLSNHFEVIEKDWTSDELALAQQLAGDYGLFSLSRLSETGDLVGICHKSGRTNSPGVVNGILIGGGESEYPSWEVNRIIIIYGSVNK